MNVDKYTKGTCVARNIVGIGVFLANIASGEGDVMDYLDIGVNGVGIYAAFALASNPVGWVIGGAAIIYGGIRLYQELSKP